MIANVIQSGLRAIMTPKPIPKPTPSSCVPETTTSTSITTLLTVSLACTTLLCSHVPQTRLPNLQEVHTSLGYLLIILGYLLLPALAIQLVNRTRSHATLRAHALSFTDEMPTNLPAFSAPSAAGPVQRDVDACTSVCACRTECAKDEDICSVCLMNVTQGVQVRVLPCGHAFHQACADLWLVHASHNSCPLCLQTVCKGRDVNMKSL